MAELNFMKHAHNVMCIELNADQELRNGWRANIAMMIYDAVNTTPMNVGTEENPLIVGEPLDPTNIEHCDALAERILRHCFPEYE